MFHWDPNPVCFTLPILGRPIVWYGVLFALGFFFGYFLMRKRVRGVIGEGATFYTDRLLWMCVAGTVIGARLGHVFFYSWPYFRQHPLDIFKVWEGGLASHGAGIGVMIALGLFHLTMRRRHPQISFLHLFDMVVLPVTLIGVFIRVGNFVNQELVGTVTSVPWAVIFGHPADGVAALPRHPVQLYEALAYAVIFCLLLRIKRRGLVGGLFLTLVFGARMALETFKSHQGLLLSAEAPFSMGQLLSIPFVLVGVALIVWSQLKVSEPNQSDLG